MSSLDRDIQITEEGISCLEFVNLLWIRFP